MQTKPLTKYQSQTARYRWLYSIVSPINIVAAFTEYKAHDSFFWVAAFDALMITALCAYAWFWKWREAHVAAVQRPPT